MDRPDQGINRLSPPEAKIALFRLLFRGRDDVYACRFENLRTGKSGYSPACGNEWVRGVCDKPRIKCTACPHQRFLPVTDEAVRRHLSGGDDTGRDFVMGVYSRMTSASIAPAARPRLFSTAACRRFRKPPGDSA